MASKPGVPGATRWPWLDGLRGIALVAMAIYHFTWDLAYFHFVPGGVLRSTLFTVFGHAIACSFLAIAGFALAIAAQPQLDLTKFLVRLAKIVIAALLVTVATWFAFPQSFVTFGILHCIAAASVISLAFMLAPFWLTGLAGALVFIAGWVIELPAFDTVNGWLGLGVRVPLTNDWRPLFPWAGAMLLGLGFGQWVLNRKMFVRAMPPPARLLQTAGRHSLIIYLLHQPLLFAMVWLAALAIQPQADANIPQGNYIRACITRCEQTGSDPGFCARACNCIAQETLRTDIWKHVVRNNLTPVLQKQYDGIIAACRR